MIAVPALGHFRGGMNPILAFWFAYVVTRPLGASIADWLGKPAESGGLGLGNGVVSLLFALAIAGFVAYLSASGKDTPEEIRVPHRRRERAPHGAVLGEPEPAPEEA